ncbi:unnamed protein product [Pylaiella littoralis]
MASDEDRGALNGMEKRLFKLVLKGATSEQWAEWLRVPLEHAVAEGDKGLAMDLLKAGANGGAGWKGCHGRTMLAAAAEGGSHEVVSTLLEAGGSDELNRVTGGYDRTALHWALAGGHTDAARVLMLAGADVTLHDFFRRTTLHYATEGGHLQLAGDLIIGGADLRADDIDGNTPLHLAAAHDDENFVCTLLRRRARRNATNNRGQRPLHVAIENKRVTVVEALLKAGANPNARYGDNERCSPLQLARCSLAMIKILLKHGAEVESSDNFGYTALHWAAGSGEPGVIDALVEAGADLEAQSGRVYLSGKYFVGLTPLHVAAVWHKFGSMAALLRNGANVDAESDQKLTPLHVVCQTCPTRWTPATARTHSSAAAADVLLRWGADETATDNSGHTPEDLIEGRSNNSQHLRRVLVNAPADRAWRRRGVLPMCRAFPGKIMARDGNGRAGKARARGEAGRGRRGGRVSRGRGVANVLAQVVELDDDETFRTVVEFL